MVLAQAKGMLNPSSLKVARMLSPVLWGPRRSPIVTSVPWMLHSTILMFSAVTVLPVTSILFFFASTSRVRQRRRKRASSIETVLVLIVRVPLKWVQTV